MTLLDSNCDPSLADWFLPANDDSVSALRLILTWFEQAVQAGQLRYSENQVGKQLKQNSKQPLRRRIPTNFKKRNTEKI